MQDKITLRKRLDACEDLYLDLFKPASGDVRALRIEVIEGRVEAPHIPVVATPSSQDPIDDFAAAVDIMTQGSRRIEVRSGCTNFVITFDRYISFCARDETYVAPEKHEDYSKRLRTYEKSRFLDFFNASTSDWALDEHIGPVKHYSIACLNVVIDVISTEEPTIMMTIIE